MAITLQKAMRIRAELKKEITYLNNLISGYSSKISFKEKKPDEKDLEKKRSEKPAALDGMSYEEILKKIFVLTDTVCELNTAIETANRDGHNLLFKESCYKSKISMINYLIAEERQISAEEENLDYDYNHMDEKGNYKRVKVKTYNYPITTDSIFGMSLIAYKKQLAKELEQIRDELSAFNSTCKIEFKTPEILF